MSIDEAFAFSAALDVRPARLLILRTEPFAITPELVVSARVGRRWLRGQQPLPSQHVQTWAEESADDERRSQMETSLRVVIGHVQRLVSATIRDDREAMADAVDAINAELDVLRERDTPTVPESEEVHGDA